MIGGQRGGTAAAAEHGARITAVGDEDAVVVDDGDDGGGAHDLRRESRLFAAAGRFPNAAAGAGRQRQLVHPPEGSHCRRREHIHGNQTLAEVRRRPPQFLRQEHVHPILAESRHLKCQRENGYHQTTDVQKDEMQADPTTRREAARVAYNGIVRLIL